MPERRVPFIAFMARHGSAMVNAFYWKALMGVIFFLTMQKRERPVTVPLSF